MKLYKHSHGATFGGVSAFSIPNARASLSTADKPRRFLGARCGKTVFFCLVKLDPRSMEFPGSLNRW